MNLESLMLLALFHCYERPLEVKARRPDVDASSSIATIISPARCGLWSCMLKSILERNVAGREDIFGWSESSESRRWFQYQVPLVHGNRTVHGVHMWISQLGLDGKPFLQSWLMRFTYEIDVLKWFSCLSFFNSTCMKESVLFNMPLSFNWRQAGLKRFLSFSHSKSCYL